MKQGKGHWCMKTRSLLVYFPGYPLALENLLPDRLLALWAACLLDAGHKTRILDYGTVSSLDRQFPREAREFQKQLCETFCEDRPLHPLNALMGYWQLRHTDRAFRARQEAFGAEVAEGLAARRNLDFVLFKLATPADFAPFARIAARLRELRPEVRIIAAGPLADHFAQSLLEWAPSLDAVCVGDIERTLVRLAEFLHQADRWCDVPNLVYRASDGLRRTEPRFERDLSAFPAPAYEPDVYPALAEGGKLLLFSVEDSRGHELPRHAAPALDRELRLKDPRAVCKEVWRLNALYGAKVFRFDGAGSPAHHILDVARELQFRGLRVLYGRSTRPEAIEPAGLPLLRASGCRALAFRVDTGSQRLLDDHYGHDFGITQAEQAVRGSRSFGMFISARFVFPCPEDDRHTQAETVRLVSRIRPDSVLVALPEILPASHWYDDSSSFGFALDRQRYFSRLLRCCPRFPLPPHRWPMVPYRIGCLSSGEVIRRQEQLLLALRQNTKVSFFPAEWALWARLTGYAGREAEFQAHTRRLLIEGLAGLAGLVGAFNGRACLPVPAVGIRSAGPLRAAVGN